MTFRRWSLVFAAVLFVATFVYYYWSLAHTFVIPSIDGPYYLIEVKGILKSGGMTYPDPPLTFYVFALIAMALKSIESGVIVGSALFAAGVSVAIYLLFKSVFKREVPAIATSIASAVSAEHISLSTNLIKNSAGILFIVGIVYFLHRSLDLKKRMRWNAVGVLGFFFLAMMTHVLDQGVALLFMGGYFVFSIVLRKGRLILSYGSMLLAATVCTVGGYLLLPEYFGDFQKGEVFASDLIGTSGVTSLVGGGSPPGASVSDPLLYVFLAAGLLLTAHEWLRGDKNRSVLIGSATVIGALFILPIIPADFAWRFELMEVLPISVIVGYACASLKGKALPILVLFLLVSPLALVGFQDAVSLTPTISVQGYSDLEKMASLVENRSVLVAQGANNAYWPEYILGLSVVSNATAWLKAGYNVYVLVGSQGGSGPINQGVGIQAVQPPSNQQLPGGGAASGDGSPDGRGQQSGGSSSILNTSNLTLVYKGSVYSLYKY